MEYHSLLGMTAEAFESVEQHFKQGEFHGLPYRYLPDYRHNVERGTVLVGDGVVRGFPKIPRTLVLETGVSREFDGDVLVEEKLNGYNARIARVEGETLAFSRSGLVCPYTTHKADRLLDLEPFFDDHPELMLCGEMYGPENPYTEHDYPDVDSVAIRLFDVRDRQSGDPLPVAERRELLADYGFPRVPYFGSFDLDEAPGAVADVVRTLDEDGREGVVMKSPDGSRQLKYTTSAAQQGSLAFAFSLPFDYGRDFMFRRLIREGFQAVEWEEDEEAVRERAHALGEAILEPMVDTFERVDDGEVVGERHTVRADPDVVDDLFAHFDDVGIQLDVHDDRTEGGERVVEFTKIMRSTTDKTRSYLDGHVVRE